MLPESDVRATDRLYRAGMRVPLTGSGRPRPAGWDLVVGGAFAAAGIALIAAAQEPLSVPRGVAVVGATLPLGWRRVAPLAALVVMVIAQSGLPGAVAPEEVTIAEFVALLVATYSLAVHGTKRDLAFGVGAIAVGMLLATWRFRDLDSLQGTLPVLVMHGLVAGVGRRLRHRELDVRRLQVMAEQREQVQAEAIREERLRIARELHDLIAHGVSVMVVHAGAGQRQLARELERARASLATIENVGREATQGLQRLLEVLRSEGAPVEPVVSLRHLDSVVEPVRSSGIEVDVDVRLNPDALPAEVALCAHRVVQEALTNVVRHADARRVRVTVAEEQGAVIVQVVDDGHGSGARDLGLSPGHGLVGMRERLRMLGGELRVTDAEGRGFVVDARIPLAVSRA